MHIFGIFHVQIAQKWQKSHDPFPWQPGLKVTSLIPVFALKDTSCANFIKIGDYRFPPILEILRSLQRSHFK